MDPDVRMDDPHAPQGAPSRAQHEGTERRSDKVVGLADVVVTHLLESRPKRTPSHGAESDALLALTRQLALDPTGLLDRLMELAAALCPGGTAGVSLLEDCEGGQIFRWVALGGALKSHVGGSTPRDHSPCGTCLDRGSPQLFDRPGRYFTYFQDAGVTIVEGLVIPMYWEGAALGTIWVLSHEEGCQFDAEHVRVMTRIADYTAAALAMRQTIETAQAAADLQQRILAIVSHDLRDPIAAIAMGIEVLKSDVKEQRHARSIERIARSCDRAGRMLRDLLDFARARAGQLMTVEKRSANIATIVKDVIEEERLVFANRVIEVRSSGDTSSTCDTDRTSQAIGNLLRNALTYSPKNSTIIVDVAGETHGVVTRVFNSGAPIPEAIRTTLFEAFRRGAKHGSDRHRSVGLGLFIVHQIAAAHRGQIACEYSDERGTCFALTLPRA
jgi:signal transduction histidine kinase